MRRGRACRGHAALCRIPNHTVNRNCRALCAEASTRGRKVHPDGGRNCVHCLRHWSLRCGRQGHDRDQRPRLFSQAGEHRLRVSGGNSDGNCRCAALRPIDRHADVSVTGRCDDGQMGHARRSSDHCHQPLFRARNIYARGALLQLIRKVPHAGHFSDGRNYWPSSGRHGASRAGGAGGHRPADGSLPGAQAAAVSYEARPARAADGALWLRAAV